MAKNIVEAGARRGANRVNSDPLDHYVGALLVSLAVFRFFSYAMAIGLLYVVQQDSEATLLLNSLVTLVGLYNIAIIAVRFNPAKRSPVLNWLVLTADVAMCLLLVLTTKGLDSAFLIYSLAPILTASLLLDMKYAMALAVLMAGVVTGAHILGGLPVGGLPWILSLNYLAFALLYSLVCLLAAYLPSLANLNWQSRVRVQMAAAERQRLRREIHDNVAQTLAFLSLKMKRAEEKSSESKAALSAKDIRGITQSIERAYMAVRDYLDGTDDAISGLPLSARLAGVVKEWKQYVSSTVEMKLTDESLGLTPQQEYQLLQIAREALANVGKHASATRVRLTLAKGKTGIVLTIKDNGVGFSESRPRGHGMNIMEERARMVGASITVASIPGEGTEVVVKVP